MDEYSKLKTALGISSRSLVHHWDKAGAPGQIPGYANHVNATSRAAPEGAVFFTGCKAVVNPHNSVYLLHPSCSIWGRFAAQRGGSAFRQAPSPQSWWLAWLLR